MAAANTCSADAGERYAAGRGECCAIEFDAVVARAANAAVETATATGEVDRVSDHRAGEVDAIFAAANT